VASTKKLSFVRQFVLQGGRTSIVIVSARLYMRENGSVGEQSVVLRASGVLATRAAIWTPL
jgi:hypothetical protein